MQLLQWLVDDGGNVRSSSPPSGEETGDYLGAATPRQSSKATDIHTASIHLIRQNEKTWNPNMEISGGPTLADDRRDFGPKLI